MRASVSELPAGKPPGIPHHTPRPVQAPRLAPGLSAREQEDTGAASGTGQRAGAQPLQPSGHTDPLQSRGHSGPTPQTPPAPCSPRQHPLRRFLSHRPSPQQVPASVSPSSRQEAPAMLRGHVAHGPFWVRRAQGTAQAGGRRPRPHAGSPLARQVLGWSPAFLLPRLQVSRPFPEPPEPASGLPPPSLIEKLLGQKSHPLTPERSDLRARASTSSPFSPVSPTRDLSTLCAQALAAPVPASRPGPAPSPVLPPPQLPRRPARWTECSTHMNAAPSSLVSLRLPLTPSSPWGLALAGSTDLTAPLGQSALLLSAASH